MLSGSLAAFTSTFFRDEPKNFAGETFKPLKELWRSLL